MYMLLRFLLIMAHFLYNIYYFIQRWCLWFMLYIKQFEYLFKNNNYSFINANNQFFELSKIPRHLAVLVGQEDISNLDFMKFTSWCIAAEIPYVTFYDYKGFIQKNPIPKEVNQLESFSKNNVDVRNVSNNIDENIKNINKIKKNGTNVFFCTNSYENLADIINAYKIKIQVLSYCDGKDKIIALTKSLAKLIDLNFLQVGDITSELLDEKLTLNKSIPDPDLALVCGKTMCNYGFLPWHTKITEFFTISSIHDMSLNSFIKTLIQFSECQQRYGQ